MQVNREGISLLRFLLFLSSCLFCAHAPSTQAIQASYIMLHFDVSFRSTWIEEFGIHPGTRVIYFFKYTCVALGCGSIKKESYEERSIIWQLPYRNWKYNSTSLNTWNGIFYNFDPSSFSHGRINVRYGCQLSIHLPPSFAASKVTTFQSLQFST